MGMRQNIKLEYSTSNSKMPSTELNTNVIYIYSHWDGDDSVFTSPLAQKLKKALARRERWDDEMYLARIIFCEIVKDDIDGETGYGIGPEVGDDEYPTIIVNIPKQTVNGVSFEDFINDNY